MEKFSLIEELLLLTLEDRGGEFDRVPEAFLVCGIAGGALIDRYDRLWWYDARAHAFVCRTPLA